MIKENGDGKPAISVIIIDSRSDKHPEWVDKAISSVKEQTLENIELIVLDNRDRKCSIGAVYNRGMELATADWVYLLGDDDFVSPDYFASLITFIYKYATEDTVACTTYSTFFDDEKKESSINAMTPFGAFRRDYILKNPFDETLTKYVDVNIYERIKKDGKKAQACRWHFGYYYRQHEGNVSGRKNIKPISLD